MQYAIHTCHSYIVMHFQTNYLGTIQGSVDNIINYKNTMQCSKQFSHIIQNNPIITVMYSSTYTRSVQEICFNFLLTHFTGNKIKNISLDINDIPHQIIKKSLLKLVCVLALLAKDIYFK